MTKRGFDRAVTAGKLASMCVGLAVILAVVLGTASSSLAANGKPFILGKSNVATKVSTLINKGVGPALRLNVGADQPPLVVSAESGTATGLSADELDGRDSSDFLGAGQKAADADRFDGLNSTDFPRTRHATIEPAYGTPTSGNRQHLLTLPTGDSIDWGCIRVGDNYYRNDVALQPGSGGSRRTVIVQETTNESWVYENYGGVGGGLGGNAGIRSVDTYTLRTTTANTPSPFVATVEVVVYYRQATCHVSAQGFVSGGV